MSRSRKAKYLDGTGVLAISCMAPFIGALIFCLIIWAESAQFRIMGVVWGAIVGVAYAIVGVPIALAIRRRNVMLVNHCEHCDYNLSGTLKAGGTTCPECGHVITAGEGE